MKTNYSYINRNDRILLLNALNNYSVGSICEWQDIQTVVDQQITIPANGLLKLDTGLDNLGAQIFPGFNNLDVKADSSSGDYRVYARFEVNNNFIEDSWEFVVD